MSDLGNDPTQVNVPVGGNPPPPAGPRGPGDVDPSGPDGTDGPQNRWAYIAIAVLLVVIVAGLAFFLLKDDGDDDQATPGDTTTVVVEETTTTVATIPPTVPTSPPPEPTAPTVTTPAPATTVPVPSDTTDPAECRESGSSPDDPELPAQVVFVAWTRTDVECAQELMTSGAFDILFGRDGTDARDQFQGCNEAEDADPYFDCAFTYEGGATHYLMNYSATDGWTVFDVTQVAD